MGPDTVLGEEQGRRHPEEPSLPWVARMRCGYGGPAPYRHPVRRHVALHLHGHRAGQV